VFDINTVLAIDLHQERLRKLLYAFSVKRVAINSRLQMPLFTIC
jgi:hypothetical protein